jgi:hypothetical protein
MSRFQRWSSDYELDFSTGFDGGFKGGFDLGYEQRFHDCTAKGVERTPAVEETLRMGSAAVSEQENHLEHGHAQISQVDRARVESAGFVESRGCPS